jgi:hypothetical protein
VPPDELQPSTVHEKEFNVNITKAQIERFPALDEKVQTTNENSRNTTGSIAVRG